MTDSSVRKNKVLRDCSRLINGFFEHLRESHMDSLCCFAVSSDVSMRGFFRGSFELKIVLPKCGFSVLRLPQSRTGFLSAFQWYVNFENVDADISRL